MMRLHYLVKLKIGCSFCENSIPGKAQLKKFYLLALILLIIKIQLLTLTSRYGKFNPKTCTK